MNALQRAKPTHIGIDWAAEPDPDELRRLRHLIHSDPSAAVPGLERLASRGSPMSHFYLGDIYRNGDAVGRNLGRAETLYRQAAAMGSVHGTYGLALVYENTGRYPESIEYLMVGISRGFSPSIRKMGWVYMNGLGVEVNHRKAREYWESAARLGNIFAKGHLSHLLISGQFGIWQVLRGVSILLNAILSAIFTILFEDRYSDKLR